MDDPTNEMEVVALFSKMHFELGYPTITRVQPQFPDATVRDQKKREKKIEFKFKSMEFEKSGYDKTKVDKVICWEDDWGPLAEVPVLELRSFIYG